jgi:hypothetical protein
MNAILHGQNSTSQPEWHLNPITRGTWGIYQTCIIGQSILGTVPGYLTDGRSMSIIFYCFIVTAGTSFGFVEIVLPPTTVSS